MTATFRVPPDQDLVMRQFHELAFPSTCAFRRASDNWTAVVQTAGCEVGGQRGGGQLIDPLADDPLVTVWVMDTVTAVATDRITVASGPHTGDVYEVTVVPPHEALAMIQGLGCVQYRPQGVPS